MPFTLIAPDAIDIEGTHYGIPVSTYGEDGDMLALGHHPRRTALAAFNRHARLWIGWPNIADDYSARAQDWLNAVTDRWATFNVPDPERGEDTDCTWYVRWCTPDTPDARPVTWLPASPTTAPKES